MNAYQGDSHRPTSFFIEDILLSKGPKPLQSLVASRELQGAAAVQAALQHATSGGVVGVGGTAGGLLQGAAVHRMTHGFPGLTGPHLPVGAGAEYGLAYLPGSAFLPHQPLAAHPAFLHKPLDPFLLHPGSAAAAAAAGKWLHGLPAHRVCLYTLVI